MSSRRRELRGFQPRPIFEASTAQEELGVRALQLQLRAMPELIAASERYPTLDNLGLHTIYVAGKTVAIDARLLFRHETLHTAHLAVSFLDGPQRVEVATYDRQPVAVVRDENERIVDDKETLSAYIDTLIGAQGIISAVRKKSRRI